MLRAPANVAHTVEPRRSTGVESPGPSEESSCSAKWEGLVTKGNKVAIKPRNLFIFIAVFIPLVSGPDLKWLLFFQRWSLRDSGKSWNHVPRAPRFKQCSISQLGVSPLQYSSTEMECPSVVVVVFRSLINAEGSCKRCSYSGTAPEYGR